MDIIISVIAFFLGTVFAGFALVLSDRCSGKLSRLSQLRLKGRRCRCKASLGRFEFCFAGMGGVGFLAVARTCRCRGARPTELLLLFALVFLFLVMAAVDRETHEVYNSTLILFVLVTVLLLMERRAFRLPELWDHLGGALFGCSFFLAVAFIGKAVLKRDALGMGDVWLAGIGGLLLGTVWLLLAILLASMLGSVLELWKIKSGRAERTAEIAFGPYLLFGIGLFAVCGQEISDFFWRVVLL